MSALNVDYVVLCLEDTAFNLHRIESVILVVLLVEHLVADVVEEQILPCATLIKVIVVSIIFIGEIAVLVEHGLQLLHCLFLLVLL